MTVLFDWHYHHLCALSARKHRQFVQFFGFRCGGDSIILFYVYSTVSSVVYSLYGAPIWICSLFR